MLDIIGGNPASPSCWPSLSRFTRRLSTPRGSSIWGRVRRSIEAADADVAIRRHCSTWRG
jgi:hypothetical protein